jgi:CubicO group peptidase (beta-lactamase class C family)/fluoride ion exporter CrcB/FEX
MFLIQKSQMPVAERIGTCTWLLLTGLTLACLLTSVEAAATPTSSPAMDSVVPLTTEDLTAFFDGLIPSELQRDDIAGAVIAVVKDGRVLLGKGYGYADTERQIPASFENTLFRVGSVSKPFVWTAVLQLMESGKLDLDRDVNGYLDFKIPPSNFSEPITVRHLLTHTAGFQETIRGLYPRNSTEARPLRDSLIEFLPPRIFAPGTTPAYSNYGTMLAAYIVQRTSGEPFEEYVERHIFQPLGMTHSTFRQPLPDALAPLLSRAYDNASDPARPFELYHYFPAAGLAATAQDVTRFMLACLQAGSYGDAQILTTRTAALMFEPQLELAAGMPGMTFGFSEGRYRGHRYVGHGGDVWGFHSEFVLVPALNLGIFFSANSSGQGDPRRLLFKSMMDRYFPAGDSGESGSAQTASDSRPLAGYYKSTRRWDISVLKLRSLYNEAKIAVNADGTITSDRIQEHGKPKVLREVAPMRFCDSSGDECIAFRRDGSGELQLVAMNPYEVFQRVPWYEDRPLNLVVLGTSVAIFVLTMIGWIAGALTRRHFGHRLSLSRGEAWLRWTVFIVCAIDLFCIVAGRALAHNLYETCHEPKLRAVQVLGIVGALGTLPVLYYGLCVARSKERSWVSKVTAVTIGIACIGFTAFGLVWRLFDLSQSF